MQKKNSKTRGMVPAQSGKRVTISSKLQINGHIYVTVRRSTWNIDGGFGKRLETEAERDRVFSRNDSKLPRRIRDLYSFVEAETKKAELRRKNEQSSQ